MVQMNLGQVIGAIEGKGLNVLNVVIVQVQIKQRFHADKGIIGHPRNEVIVEVQRFQRLQPLDGFRRNTMEQVAGQIQREQCLIQVEEGHGVDGLDVGARDGQMMDVQMLELQAR